MAAVWGVDAHIAGESSDGMLVMVISHPYFLSCMPPLLHALLACRDAFVCNKSKQTAEHNQPHPKTQVILIQLSNITGLNHDFSVRTLVLLLSIIGTFIFGASASMTNEWPIKGPMFGVSFCYWLVSMGLSAIVSAANQGLGCWIRYFCSPVVLYKFVLTRMRF